MIGRHATPLLGLCLAIAAASLLSPAAAQQWVVPRTPEGHPDLQGNWTNATLTPFERREGQGPVMTPDEVDRLEGRAVAQARAGSEPSDPDRARLEPEERFGRSYNEIYYERNGYRVVRVNGEPRSSMLTRPANGRRPALTPGAQRRQREAREFRSQFGEADNPENRGWNERCIMFSSRAGPPMIPNGAYNKNYTIVQTADYVMIHAEMVHDTRIIRLGEPDRLPAYVRPWMGDSWGRWEGDALVVETRNINPSQLFRGIAPTAEMKVIERFTRVDEETVLYEFTIDDPTSYTQPWGGELPYKRFDKQLYEYACHEGNYSLANVLSGARYQERQARRK